jgi:TatD DNase family protein
MNSPLPSLVDTHAHLCSPEFDHDLKQKLVKHLPLACLLVETDSPVLGAEPAVRNEPANLPLAVKAIAGIKGIPEQQVVEAVAANTVRLYGPLVR